MTTTAEPEANVDATAESPPYDEPAPPLPPSDDDREHRRGRIALVSVTALSFVLNVWGVGAQGLGNTYYAAAARSMSQSWHNWFFNVFDPGGYITVDKPPVATWIQALSVRVFGFSPTSLMLPSAIAGAAAVAILWCTIRPRFGIVAATVSAGILALSPINVAVNRLNLPDPFMILFLVAAAWAVMRSLDSEHGLRWVLLAGLFVGVAFNTKMLAAYIPVPAIGLAVLIGTTGSWWRRIGRGLAFGASALVCSLPWMVVVDLWSKSARPYIGGSTNNTVFDLVFGYNGFGRVDGNGQGGGGQVTGGALNGPGGVFGGSPGLFRLWNDAVGGQIAWLLPLGVAAAVAALWLHRRDRARMAGRRHVRGVGRHLRRGVQLREGNVPQLLHERARAGARCDHRHRWRRAGQADPREPSLARARRCRARRDRRRPDGPHRAHPGLLRLDRRRAHRGRARRRRGPRCRHLLRASTGAHPDRPRARAWRLHS